jgi:hypothetical protein
MDGLTITLPGVIGLLATGLSVGAFLLTGPRRILAISTLGSVVWIMHFGLLGAWAGAATSLGSTVRNGAGAWLDRRAMIWFTWLAAGAVVTVGLLVDPRGYVILLSAPIRAFANHLRNHELLFRLTCSLSGTMYVVYGMAIGSFTVLLSAVVTTSVVLGAPLVRSLRARRHAI